MSMVLVVMATCHMRRCRNEDRFDQVSCNEIVRALRSTVLEVCADNDRNDEDEKDSKGVRKPLQSPHLVRVASETLKGVW